MSSIDLTPDIAVAVPARQPDRLVRLAQEATGEPVGLYVADIEGFLLVGIACPAGFPAEIPIRSGLGPEMGALAVAEARHEIERVMPGAVAAPLWVNGRATALLLAPRDPRGALEAVAHEAAPTFELSSGYTDVVDRARRLRRTSAAAEVQQDLLAPRIAPVEGGEVAGSLLPAYDVGGDWFDHAGNPEGVWLAVGDAMGKGSRAAAVSALALAALRGARRSGDTLEDCCQAIHDVIEQLGAVDTWFLTAVVATWDVQSGMLSWVCCGHPAPLLIRADGGVEELEGERTLPLGLEVANPRTFVRNQRRLASGDRVLLYSDGITERRAQDGRFGLEGLVAAVRDAPDPSAAATTAAVEQAVLGASEAPISDDATQLVLRVD